MVRKEEGDTSRKNLPGQTARWKPEDYTTPVGRGADRLCTWISRDFPHLSAWELHAREFIGRSKKSIPVKLKAISLFVERYLNTAGVKNEPGEKLDPSVARRPIADSSGADALLLRVNRDKVPDTISALNESASKAELRAIRDEFIEDILNFHCSAEDEGGLVRLIEYYNPFIGSDLANAQGNTPTSTVRSAMPYRWIRLLRGILAQGPHFCDWKWAQQAQTSSVGNSADWFEVDESIIDKYDPDCVWRCRTTGGSHYRQERTIYEIWSPVRWLVLLTKLNTALRTVQVRVLDSGESDHWRFDLREWATLTYKANTLEGGVHGSSQGPVSTVSPWVENDIANRNPTLNRATIPQTELLRRGGRRTSQVWSNGALRRVFTNTEDGVRRFDTVVYANSNKTADARKEGAAKGFEIPLPLGSCPLPPDDAYWIRPGVQLDPAWPEVSSPRHREVWLEDLSENTHWWLAKLRDWQEKYNPIKRRIEWKELSRSGLVAEKADEQYEMYLPTCFLFREPSMNKSVKHPGPAFPLPDNVASQAWWSLNKELQDRLNTRRPEGQPPFKLVVSHQGETRVCIFDLHSIRVSLITALIVDGKVPVEIVQKMVGHSRLVMTIYYTVITPLHMEKQIYAGFKRAKEVEVETELAFLQNATAQEVRSRAAFNDEESAFAALGLSKQPVYRSVVMWARVLGGICPVGAATHDTEAGLKAGCFNGGSHISGSGIHAKYRPVEGGPGTCVNCRFLITMQPHIGELQAIYETAAYRKHEIHERALQQDSVVNQSKDAWDRAEANGANRLQLASLERAVDEAENLRERILADFAVEIVTAANAERLVVRLVSCLNTPGESNASKALVLNGGEQDAKLIMGQTSSAMLHAARISLHCELHPELRPSGAILRGSEILAKKLYSEGADPFALLALPEDVRHKALNAAMRDLSERLSPQDFETGLAMAVRLIESPHSLSDTLGLSRGKLSDWMAGCASDARDSASPTLQQSQPLRLS